MHLSYNTLESMHTFNHACILYASAACNHSIPGFNLIKKPPQTAVKKLTTILVKKLPKKKGKATLEKNDFEKQFAKYLFEIHDEMKEKEENEL